MLLLGFIILFACFGIRLATRESTNDWKEADITIADVQHISRKPNTWKITDIEGNTYSAHESQITMNQILPQSTYHIVYSPNNNDIRAITQGDLVIVDYAHSVSVHCERNIWDWILALLGMTGSVATIVCMIIDVRKNIPKS